MVVAGQCCLAAGQGGRRSVPTHGWRRCPQRGGAGRSGASPWRHCRAPIDACAFPLAQRQPYALAHGFAQSDPHTDLNAYTDAVSGAHADPNAHTNADADSHAYAHANPNANPQSFANSLAHAG